MVNWRFCASVPLLLLVSAVAAPSVLAADDDAAAVVADCGAADLPDSKVDSCLERARVLDETAPSPELQSLEAQLQQRESGGRTAQGRPKPLQSSADLSASGMKPHEVQREQSTDVGAEAGLSANAAEPDQSGPAEIGEPVPANPDKSARRDTQLPAGATAEQPPTGIDDDEPPVADPPDDATTDQPPRDGDDPQ